MLLRASFAVKTCDDVGGGLRDGTGDEKGRNLTPQQRHFSASFALFPSTFSTPANERKIVVVVVVLPLFAAASVNASRLMEVCCH